MPGGKNALSEGSRIDSRYKSGDNTNSPRAMLNADTVNPSFTCQETMDENNFIAITYHISPSESKYIGYIYGHTQENGRAVNFPLFGKDIGFSLTGPNPPNVMIGCLQLNTAEPDNVDSYFDGEIKEFFCINFGSDLPTDAEVQKLAYDYHLHQGLDGVNI